MKHSTTTPTKAEAARFAKLKALGCVACILENKKADEPVEPEIHHYLSGGKRIGHDASVPLCYWHHHGLPFDEVPTAWLLAELGPSFHKHTRAFRLRYGTDKELIETVNGMIANG